MLNGTNAGFWDKMKDLFVPKESGKILTSNDFTDAYKNKLDGIANNANNYSLPIASSNTLGGIKVGNGLSISNGVLSASGNNSFTILTQGAIRMENTENNWTQANLSRYPIKGNEIVLANAVFGNWIGNGPSITSGTAVGLFPYNSIGKELEIACSTYIGGNYVLNYRSVYIDFPSSFNGTPTIKFYVADDTYYVYGDYIYISYQIIQPSQN